MLTHEALTSQIEALTRELARVISAECQKYTAQLEARIAALTSELDKARTVEQTAQTARQALELDLEKARKRIATLTNELNEARLESAAARAGAQEHDELRQQVAALQGEVEQERSIRKRLEKGAAADERRLHQLESALAAGPASEAAAVSPGGVDREMAQLQRALQQAVASLEEERAARQGLEQELDEADRMIAALEKALKGSRKISPAVMPAESAPAVPKPAKGKPLPHEVRPAPKPGARFHPDWELSGLPCRDADQVALAWGSVANVQLSLEGYPAQYCAAFLVVLKQGRQKRLYLLFNLKSSRHTLVCVPDQPPGDEAALNKQISEARSYLQISGFELEKIASREISALLGGYFLKE
jgi:predicted  nucleic acid-binding Zn-ribbon protein